MYHHTFHSDLQFSFLDVNFLLVDCCHCLWHAFTFLFRDFLDFAKLAAAEETNDPDAPGMIIIICFIYVFFTYIGLRSNIL